MKPNKTEITSKMGKMMKTLANNQAQNKKIQHTTRLQVNHNNAGTEYNMHSGPTDIDTDVEQHFMNGKLIFNSV